MESTDTERILNEIGQILADDKEFPLDGTLLYAEVAPSMVNPSIFKDLGDHVLYTWPSDKLTYPLLDLRQAEAPDKRWTTLEYLIRDGKFDAIFTYPEEIDPEEDPMDRRDRILKKYYGDKPVHYPPLSGDEVFQI